MSDDRKDVEWLKQKVVSLLEDAASAETKDHSACAKYADLLFKMLPRGEKQPDSSLVDKIRKAVQDGK